MHFVQPSTRDAMKSSKKQQNNMMRFKTTVLITIAFAANVLPALGQEMEQATATAEAQLSPYDQASENSERAWLSTGSGKELAFYLPESSGKAHGGVLMIPDRGHHPTTDGDINALRHSLASNHWHTLALDTDGQDAEAVQNTIKAGIAFLNDKGVFNIAVLGEGQGAGHALRYVASLPPVTEGEIRQIRALLMLNANNTLAGVQGNAMAPLATIKLPVLDAFYANDYREQKQAAARKQLPKPGSKFYQQSRLPYSTTQTSPMETPAARRIRGWLDKHAAGFMVDRK